MQYKNKAMHVNVEDNGIIVITIPESWEGPNTLEVAKENVAILTKAVGNEIRGMLSHMPDTYMSKEVMNYYKSVDMGEVASAMLAKSFGAKVLGNFFLRIMGNKRGERQVPIRLFTDEDKARAWLLEKIEEGKAQKSQTILNKNKDKA